MAGDDPAGRSQFHSHSSRVACLASSGALNDDASRLPSAKTAARLVRGGDIVNGESSRPLLQSAENPGSNYNREPTIAEIARDMDVMVPMRDGVKICIDVYRPDAPGKFPALLAFAIYNKDFQGPDMAAAPPAPPARSAVGAGADVGGETKFFV